jgi:hypothetical protein
MKATSSTLHSLRASAPDQAGAAPRSVPRASAWLSCLVGLLSTPETAREAFLAASADHEDYERRVRLWVERERQQHRRALQPPAF